MQIDSSKALVSRCVSFGAIFFLFPSWCLVLFLVSLDDQTRSYVPYWRWNTGDGGKFGLLTARHHRRALQAIQDGLISSIGIMKQLPVAFRLSDGVTDRRMTRSYWVYWKPDHGGDGSAGRDHRRLIDGEISSAGIMKQLPVDFRLADT